MVYGDFKDLNRRIATDKVLCDKAFGIAKNSKYEGYQRGVDSMAYKFLIKKLVEVVLKMKLFLIKNYTNQLLETLRKEKYTQIL